MTKRHQETDQQQYTKLYYAISEVAKMTGVKAHVLRYWETEFPSLKPRKTRTGSRRYRPGDIDEVLVIKSLLYDQGFKIAGARKFLREQKATARQPSPVAAPQLALPFEQMDPAGQLAVVKEELGQLQQLVRQMAAERGQTDVVGKTKTAAAKG